MLKIGILGGTFDPVHYGHLMLADQAACVYGLSKILFVPSGQPPHKDVQKITSAPHRVEMLNIAIDGNSLFEVSTVECDNREVSYTYATLDTLRGLYSRGTGFYYIIGSDVLNFISKFRNAPRVFGSCELIVSARPGADFHKTGELADKLTKMYGARIAIMDFPEIEISSSLIREKLSGGGSARYMLPGRVIEYIERNGLYTAAEDTALSGYWESAPEAEPRACGTGALDAGAKSAGTGAKAAGTGAKAAGTGAKAASTGETRDMPDGALIDRIKGMVSARLSKKRWEHTLGVMRIAVELTEFSGGNVTDAALAGLLHDYMREAPPAELVRVCKSDGINASDLELGSPFLLHAQAGAAEARQLLGDRCGPDIIDAITSHTTGRENMGTLAKIIFFADAVEPGREYEAARQARKMFYGSGMEAGSFIKKLDEAVLFLLERQIEHIIQTGRPLHPDTVVARNWLLSGSIS